MKTIAPAALALLLALASAASAQYRPGYPGGYPGGYGTRPTTSPYLNLLGRGNPAVNYYGIIRPQQEFRNALYGGAGPAAPGGPEEMTDPELHRGTGHAVTFGNLSHYYYNHPADPNQAGGYGAGGAARFNTTAGSFGAAGTSYVGRRGGSYGAYRGGSYGAAGSSGGINR